MKTIKQIVKFTLVLFIVDLVIDIFWYNDKEIKTVFFDNLETIWILFIVASVFTLIERSDKSKNEAKNNKQRRGGG
ncbi:MAG TPA: hypothetical protein VFI78_07320 [Salinimicrobium sp.]|nr:hypothetical protein [Salinimicrobium sp.]